MRRARAYADAGADAVLVHSKEPDFGELKRLRRGLDAAVPLVAVPTTYPDVGLDELAAAGFRWRSSRTNRCAPPSSRCATRSRRMRETGRAGSVDDRIVPLDEVYRLVGVPELKANERRFLFAGADPPKAIILAAGFEPQLLPLTRDRPKTMLDVKGRTILERQVEALGRVGIRDVVVVRGYQKEQVSAPGVRFVDNDRWAETGELYSLMSADAELAGPCVVPVRRHHLRGARCWRSSCARRPTSPWSSTAPSPTRCAPGEPLPPGPLDLVVTETPPHGRRFVAPEGGTRVLRIGPEVTPEEAHGEFIGLAMLSARGRRRRCARCMPSWPRSAPRGSIARASPTSSRP